MFKNGPLFIFPGSCIRLSVQASDMPNMWKDKYPTESGNKPDNYFFAVDFKVVMIS